MIKKQKGSKDQSISESIEPEQVYSNVTVVASTKNIQTEIKSSIQVLISFYNQVDLLKRSFFLQVFFYFFSGPYKATVTNKMNNSI